MVLGGCRRFLSMATEKRPAKGNNAVAKLPPQSANELPVSRPPQRPRTGPKRKPKTASSIAGPLRQNGQTLEAWGGYDWQSDTNVDEVRRAHRRWTEFTDTAFRLCDRLQRLAEKLESEKPETLEASKRAGWIYFWAARISLWLDSDPAPSVDAWMYFQPGDEEDHALAEAEHIYAGHYNAVWTQLKDCRTAFNNFSTAWAQLKEQDSASPEESQSGERTEQPKNSAVEVRFDSGSFVKENAGSDQQSKPSKAGKRKSSKPRVENGFAPKKTPVPEKFRENGHECGPLVGDAAAIYKVLRPRVTSSRREYLRKLHNTGTVFVRQTDFANEVEVFLQTMRECNTHWAEHPELRRKR